MKRSRDSGDLSATGQLMSNDTASTTVVVYSGISEKKIRLAPFSSCRHGAEFSWPWPSKDPHCTIRSSKAPEQGLHWRATPSFNMHLSSTIRLATALITKTLSLSKMSSGNDFVIAEHYSTSWQDHICWTASPSLWSQEARFKLMRRLLGRHATLRGHRLI